MAWTWKKTLVVVGSAVGGGVLLAVTGGLAAPAIGTLIGTGMGLSGAAATSAGLASLGGGALAAGGAGMAGGTAIVVGTGAAIGTATAGGAATLAAASLDDARRCGTCNDLLDEDAQFCAHCGKQV